MNILINDTPAMFDREGARAYLSMTEEVFAELVEKRALQTVMLCNARFFVRADLDDFVDWMRGPRGSCPENQ
jgi:hypothetical protein